MNLRSITDLADLARVSAQDELPTPLQVIWSSGIGLNLMILEADLDAWLRISQAVPEGFTEKRAGGWVYSQMPRLIDGLPVTLSYHVQVDEAAWLISNSSSLSYEEAARWLVDWNSGDWTHDQRVTALEQIQQECGVPAACLPVLDEQLVDVR